MFIPNGDTHSTHGVLTVRPFNTKKTSPKSPMGINPQESLTKSDETRNVQNPIGSKVMQLEPIRIQQPPERKDAAEGQTHDGRKPGSIPTLPLHPFVRGVAV